jgi:hypothetical protein
MFLPPVPAHHARATSKGNPALVKWRWQLELHHVRRTRSSILQCARSKFSMGKCLRQRPPHPPACLSFATHDSRVTPPPVPRVGPQLPLHRPPGRRYVEGNRAGLWPRGQRGGGGGGGGAAPLQLRAPCELFISPAAVPACPPFFFRSVTRGAALQVVFADNSVAGLLITAAFFAPMIWHTDAVQVRARCTSSIYLSRHPLPAPPLPPLPARCASLLFGALQVAPFCFLLSCPLDPPHATPNRREQVFSALRCSLLSPCFCCRM